jgi:hypothetical protein
LERFAGRPEHKLRFAAGDLTEVWFGGKVTLQIVCNLPPPPKNEPRAMDYKRDRYWTLNRLGDISCLDASKLFPTRLKVSMALREEYRTYYEKVLPLLLK